MASKSKPDWLSCIDLKLLDAFVDNPYECPIVIDGDGIVRFMSRYNEGLYGFTPEQAVGRHITEVNKDSHMHETLVTGKAMIGEIYQAGGRRQVMARIPLRNRSGNIVGVLGKRIFHKTDTVKELYSKMEILEGQLKYYHQEVSSLKGSYEFGKIIGQSAPIQEALRGALQASRSDASVLITGESGTGKESCAYFIHRSSRRAEGPYIRVNCAAVPAELIESELFGYEGGAFTGARPGGKPGKFELAHKGTILLDEIGDMPLNMQAKLLRVLQEREIERVGGTKPVKVDFRLIASTNKDLQEMIKKGTFRMDLFYRLNIFNIVMPGLRAIPGDIPEISRFMIQELSGKTSIPAKTMSGEVAAAMQRYHWPGNVRELRNVIERAMIVAEGPEILLEHLPPGIAELGRLSNGGAESARHMAPLREVVLEAERRTISEVLKHTGGNKVRAARILGIHRTILYQKIKRYKIPL
ncbi:MAG: sigma 54-interacting transcriptional regulator [Syntrophaceae bacterium]